VSAFPKTRAAAVSIATDGASNPARIRAAIVLARLRACEDALASGNREMTAPVASLLRSLVIAARDLAGHGWPRAATTQTLPRSPPWTPRPARPSRLTWMRSSHECSGHGLPVPCVQDRTTMTGTVPVPAVARLARSGISRTGRHAPRGGKAGSHGHRADRRPLRILPSAHQPSLNRSPTPCRRPSGGWHWPTGWSSPDSRTTTCCGLAGGISSALPCSIRRSRGLA